MTSSFSVLQTCDIDVEKVVSEGRASPFTLIAGTAGEESSHYYICCKQEVLVEPQSMMEAVLVLLAVFHTFDL